MVICFNCEISPNMIGIQDEYNKTSILSSLNIMRSLILDNCFEYKDGDIRVVLVE